jgi:hypothetical protein
MRSFDNKQARKEETVGETASGDYASRKGRLTPRQMWARQARRHAKARAQTADAEPREEAVPAEAGFGEDMAPLATSVGEEPQENEDLQDDEVILEIVEEDLDDEVPAAEEVVEESEEKPEPVMVDASMQPGAMNYPFATYRPAPDAPETEKASGGFQRRLSSGFMIGVVVIVFALILGISFAGQRKRIAGLEERVRVLEDAGPSGKLFVGR